MQHDASNGNPFREADKPGIGLKLLGVLILVGLCAAAVSSVVGLQMPIEGWIPVVGVTIWLCSLAGFWLAFGKHWIRFVSLPIPVLNAFYLYWLVGGGDLLALVALYAGIVLVVALTGVALRVLFGELRRHVHADSRDALQFDLRHLFILMTTIAVLIGVGRSLLQQSGIWLIGGHVAFVVAVLVLSISAMTLVSIWACLGKTLSVTRMIAVCISIVVAATAAGFVMNGGEGAKFWVPTVLLEQALMLGALLCVRLEGYRFIRAPS